MSEFRESYPVVKFLHDRNAEKRATGGSPTECDAVDLMLGWADSAYWLFNDRVGSLYDQQYALGQWHGYKSAMRALATQHVDHPDYRDEWRP